MVPKYCVMKMYDAQLGNMKFHAEAVALNPSTLNNLNNSHGEIILQSQ